MYCPSPVPVQKIENTVPFHGHCIPHLQQVRVVCISILVLFCVLLCLGFYGGCIKACLRIPRDCHCVLWGRLENIVCLDEVVISYLSSSFVTLPVLIKYFTNTLLLAVTLFIFRITVWSSVMWGSFTSLAQTCSCSITLI